MPLPIAELARCDISQVASYLAARQADIHARGVRWQEKQANGFADTLSALGQKVMDDPILSKALLGGGIGALAGGATHVLGGRDEHPDPEVRAKRRGGWLSKMLTGGLAGAALG